MILATSSWHVAGKLECTDGVRSALPDPSNTMIVMHATTIRVLDDVKGKPIRLAPFPSLIDEFDWDEEGPLVEQFAPGIARHTYVFSNLELQGTFKRTDSLGRPYVATV
jgi:hypothetical protein